LWCDDHDRPIEISTRGEWDKAAAEGLLTPEHVLLRLEAIVRVAFDDPVDGGVAYGADGFVRAEVAAGWVGEGWRLQLHPNDHDPPHVHFWKKGDPKREVRLDLRSGQPLDGESIPRGARRQLDQATQFIRDHQDLLRSTWGAAHS